MGHSRKFTRDKAVALVTEALKRQPDTTLEELIELVWSELGLKMSEASMSRLCQETGVKRVRRPRPSISDRIAPTIEKLLQTHPNASIKQLRERALSEYGLEVSQTSMSRLREQLGYAPVDKRKMVAITKHNSEKPSRERSVQI